MKEEEFTLENTVDDLFGATSKDPDSIELTGESVEISEESFIMIAAVSLYALAAGALIGGGIALAISSKREKLWRKSLSEDLNSKIDKCFDLECKYNLDLARYIEVEFDPYWSMINRGDDVQLAYDNQTYRSNIKVLKKYVKTDLVGISNKYITAAKDTLKELKDRTEPNKKLVKIQEDTIDTIEMILNTIETFKSVGVDKVTDFIMLSLETCFASIRSYPSWTKKLKEDRVIDYYFQNNPEVLERLEIIYKEESTVPQTVIIVK